MAAEFVASLLSSCLGRECQRGAFVERWIMIRDW